jgi:phage baseplate assembly protein W
MTNNDSFLGKGWSFPPGFSSSGENVHLVSGKEDIEQSLAILLATQRDERVMQEDFGCNLNEFLFTEISQGLIGRIRNVIEDAILHHESRIAVNNIDVVQSEIHVATLMINIDYTIRATNSRYNMVYPFYINEASVVG